MNFNMKRRKIMKHTRKLTAIILAILCLAATGCKKSTSDTDIKDPALNPDVTTNIQGNTSNIFGSSANATGEYDPNSPHGEKKVYGTVNFQEFFDWKGTIGITYEMSGTWTGYYFYDDPTQSWIICFDPLCDHCQEYCPAFDGDASYETEDGRTMTYPYQILLDKYDNANSPVIYRAYKQSSLYRPSPDMKTAISRPECYRIDRYDLSTGKRITLLTDISGTITTLNTYGDYIYYNEENADQTVTLKRLAKAGGPPISLEQDNLKTINVLDITDDFIYYTADERYLYRADADLKNPELLLDVANLKGSNDMPAVLRRIQGGYLYYYGDFEIRKTTPNEAGISGDEEYCSCYRVPLNELDSSPELVAKDFAFGYIYSAFTENYFYYQPAGSDYFSEASRSLFAVNLDSLETKQVVEDCGFLIYIQNTMGDNILFTGIPVTEEGRELCGNGKNYVIAYPDGRECEKWIIRNPGGRVQNIS